MGQGSAPAKPAKRSRKTPGARGGTTYSKVCDVCGEPFTSKRKDAKTCSRNNGRCRKKKSEAMKKVKA